MDIMLTSFGLGMGKPRRHESASGFYKLPPLVLSKSPTATRFISNYNPSPKFRFDYAALLMFERVFIDIGSYQQLLDHDLSIIDSKEGKQIVDFLKELEIAGRLVSKDFMAATSATEKVWQLALDYDLNNLSEWTEPLESSLRIWNATLAPLDSKHSVLRLEGENVQAKDVAMQLTHHHGITGPPHIEMCLNALKEWKCKQSPEVRQMARKLVKTYLSYININIALAYDFETAFVDWADFEPFYRKKFNLAGQRERRGAQEVAQVNKLIEVVFPYFLPCDMKQLVRAYEDVRIEQFRNTVRDAIEGKVEFDADFAARILRDVLKIEKQSAIRRKITGWATLPLDLIPVIGTGVQKLVEETISAVWSDRPRKKYGWFYFIDELSAEPE